VITFCRGPSNDYSWAVWFLLSKWFQRRSVLFYADRKFKMATTAGHRLTLDPMGKYSNAFFSETTKLICMFKKMIIRWAIQALGRKIWERKTLVFIIITWFRDCAAIPLSKKWTIPKNWQHTRRRIKTKNTTQYVLDITMRKQTQIT
jgi:hypothetical protein